MFIYEKNGTLQINFDGNLPELNPDVKFDLESNVITVNNETVDPIVAEKLTEDVVLDTAEVVNSAKTVVLNGNTISIPEDTVGDGVYHVVSGGYLTIEGNGIINGVGKNNYNMALWVDGGHAVINGGHFTNLGATAENDPSHMDLLYVKNGGILEINDGYFECVTPKWTINNHDSLHGTIIVRGGTFIDFDPSNTATEPAGKNNNFVAEGYKVVQEGKKYTVVKI